MRSSCASLLLLLLSLPAYAAQSYLASEAGALIADLLKQSPLQGKRVAVGEFRDSENNLTMLSDAISEDLESALVSRAPAQKFEMLQRRDLKELQKEWVLSGSGYVDDESLIEVGKLHGVNILCFGKYVRIGKKITLRVVLVETKKGKILAKASGEIKLDGDLRALADKLMPAAEVPDKIEMGETPSAPAADPTRRGVWVVNETAKGLRVIIHLFRNGAHRDITMKLGPGDKGFLRCDGDFVSATLKRGWLFWGFRRDFRQDFKKGSVREVHRITVRRDWSVSRT